MVFSNRTINISREFLFKFANVLNLTLHKMLIQRDAKIIFGYGLKNFRCEIIFQVRQTFDKIIQKVETVILTNHFTKMCIIYDRKY